MLETRIASANIEYLGYSTPQKSVYELQDEEITNNGISYPSDEYLEKCDTFINLPEEENNYMQTLWADIKASGSTSVWELVFLLAVIIGLGTVTIVYLRKRKAQR